MRQPNGAPGVKETLLLHKTLHAALQCLLFRILEGYNFRVFEICHHIYAYQTF